MSTPLAPATGDPTSALYRAVWRWHFYAGLLVAPFATFLALTGAIYLWQPQYEAWRYRDLLTASTATAPSTWVSHDAQLAAALAAAPPHSTPKSFHPAFSPGETTQVIFAPGSASSPPTHSSASEIPHLKSEIHSPSSLAHASTSDPQISNPKSEITSPASPSHAHSSDSQILHLKSEILPPNSAHHAAATITVFIDPPTGRVLGHLADDDRLMNTIKTLHSSLLAGKAGEYFVELVASWALVLFLTGLYLAWPRPRFTVFGFLLPRLRAKGRVFWRDLHAVPALWLAAASIFLLSTGLLWTNAAGGWYRTLSAVLGQDTPRESAAGAHRSELTGWSPPLRSGLAQEIDALASTPPTPPNPATAQAHTADADAHAGHHANHAVDAPPTEAPLEPTLALDRVVALAREHHAPEPFVIALPVGPTGVYSVLSDRTQPFKRTYLHLDQYSGRILADVRFKDFGYLAQFFSWGIVAHEGRLFGLANQILGTLAALGIVLLGVSGLILWWQRRPTGQLAAPVSNSSLPRPVLFGTLALAALLPLLAASLAVIFLADRFMLRSFAGSRRT